MKRLVLLFISFFTSTFVFAIPPPSVGLANDDLQRYADAVQKEWEEAGYSLIVPSPEKETRSGDGVTPAPTPLPVETPSMDVEIKPMPPIIDLGGTFLNPECKTREYKVFEEGRYQCHPYKFSDVVEAEQHLYACRVGVAWWGTEIADFEPGFQSALHWEDVQPTVPFYTCSNFEIYPDSNLCARFLMQGQTEYDYNFCIRTNYQYWDKRQSLLNAIKPEPPKPPSYCKKFGGKNIWKARRDDGRGSVTVLDSAYCPDDKSIKNQMKPRSIYLEDIYGNRIDGGNLRHCNTANENRLHYNFGFHSGEGVLQLEFEDRTECFNIPDMGRDQR